MARPCLTLLVLIGTAVLGFFFVQRLHRQNTSGEVIQAQAQAPATPVNEKPAAPVATEQPRPEPPPREPEPQEATLEGIAKRTAQLRKLDFKNPVEFVPTTFDDIAQRITEKVQGAMSEEESRVRPRACVAMGFVRDSFDYRWALSGLRIEQTGWFYDAGTNKLYVNEVASLKLPEARGRLVRALMEALLEQNHGIGDPGLGDGHNSDRAMAAQSVLGGDAQLIQLRFSLSDLLGSEGAGSAGTPPPFYEAPIYMRERQNFPYDAGRQFQEVLGQRPDSAEAGHLDRVYARMPVSTAEILHPEELYFAPEPFVPVDFQWDDLQVAEVDPIEDNVAGELNIRLLMKLVEAPDVAAEIGHGWRGDRYVVYPGEQEGAGDQVFWRTVWATAEDAADFARGIQKSLLFRFSIPAKQKYLTTSGFVVDDPNRPLRVRISADGKTVQVVIASNERFADALEAKFRMP